MPVLRPGGNTNGLQFNLVNGVINDAFGSGSSNTSFAAAPVRASFVTWTQSFQFVYQITDNTGNYAVPVSIPTTLTWSGIKVAASAPGFPGTMQLR
jgi:hypothetical protein